MDTHNPTQLREKLADYGARPEDVVVLGDRQTPEQTIRYLELLRARGAEPNRVWPSAIVESERRAVLYVVDAPAASISDSTMTYLRRVLAFRADAEKVAFFEPGRLTLYRLAPSRGRLAAEVIDRRTKSALGLALSLAIPPEEASRRVRPNTEAVRRLLFDLLTKTTERLEGFKVEPLDALSLVGRALFVRFLHDRGVIDDAICIKKCGAPTDASFSNAQRAAKISNWLDGTFNGDFLPLSPGKSSEHWFSRLNPGAFGVLSNILERNTGSGQKHLTWGNSWDDLPFSHIPLGLLSQVYEQYAHRFDPESAEATSVHYTPKHVADYMVDEVFLSLGERAHSARILDPAVGGGVFLVSAFYRLAAEYCRAKGHFPSTAALREILYEQLRGFDISEPALRLCSLGLYLAAIELDPNPHPPERLKFEEPLLGKVLHHIKNKRHPYIGSLDESAVGAEHRHHYDAVIGNPPWTGWARTDENEVTLSEQVAKVEKLVQGIINERLGPDASRRYRMIDRAPDLPFFWRAVEWAKEGGIIALALHARILFKQSPPGVASRELLFRGVEFTGILNGAALRNTKFWPNVSAPFCIMFARNEVSGPDSAFYFVSPEYEKLINDRGQARIDPESARIVSTQDVLSKSSLLKTLFRGSALDVAIMDHLNGLNLPTLAGYWKTIGGESRCGQGFQVGDKAGTKQLAKDLWGLPTLTSSNVDSSCLVDVSVLGTMPRGSYLLFPRVRTRYHAPLVLISESLPVDQNATVARIAFEDVAYSESFIGYSCKQHPQGKLLARYLLLLFTSRIHAYFALLSSAQFGVEREALYVEDIGRVPFVPFEKLSAAQIEELVRLTDAAIAGDTRTSEIDEWVTRLYGLSRLDAQVIKDSLFANLPFADNRRAATKWMNGPNEANGVISFCRSLQEYLQVFLKRRGRKIFVHVVRKLATEPWLVLQVDSSLGTPAVVSNGDDEALRSVINSGMSLSASQIIIESGREQLLIAVLAQQRYFTASRARLLALQVVRNHAAILLGEIGS